MARIKYSGLIDSINGSIGGTTFQNNKHGFTVKRKPNIVKPNSALQNERKITFSQAVKAWQGLSSAQRSDWNTWASTYPQYAKNNPSSQLTGYEVFVKVHAYRFLIGVSTITAPAYSEFTVDTLTLDIYLESGDLKLDIDSTLEDANWYVIIFISRPFSSTGNFIGSKTRYFYYVDNDDDTQTITTLYTTIFGKLPSASDRVAIDYVQIAATNGQVVARLQNVYTVGSI